MAKSAQTHKTPCPHMLATGAAEARQRQILPIPQRDAAKALGITQPAAGKLFHLLVRNGVLIEADKPPKGTMKAQRYQFVTNYPD